MTLLGGRPDSPWSEADTVLATALSIHDRELRCPCGCGGYADITLESDGFHDVEEIRCDARAALDEYQRSAKELEPGVILVPVYTGDD